MIFDCGVVGHANNGVRNFFFSRTVLESLIKEGENPVSEKEGTLMRAPKYDGTREILSEPGRTTFQG